MPSDGGYTLITDSTLGSANRTISLTGIPNTYKHLMIVLVSATSSGNTDLQIRFNNLSTSIYAALANTYNGSIGNYSSSSQPYLRATYNDVFTTANNNVTWIDIQDYTMTTGGTRAVRTRSSHNAGYRYAYSYGYAETGVVVNSVQLEVLSTIQTFNAGTRVWLYGVNGV